MTNYSNKEKTPEILRGEDANFVLKFRQNNGDPYDLTGWTKIQVKFKAQNGSYFSIDSDQIPARAASGAYDSVTYTADVAGDVGNSISLVFDGVDDIDTVVGAWNTANPANTVSSDASDGTTIPPAGTVELIGGFDPFFKVEPLTPYVLGKVQIRLLDEDTNLMRTGKRQTVFAVIDKGTHPQGERRKAKKENAIDVVASP